MNAILKLVRNELQAIIDRIDAGNSNATEEELTQLLVASRKLTEKDTPMSKYQAFNYLHVSRATFDNLVREGKIPKGVKQQGFTELQWFKKELDKYRDNLKKK